MIFVVVGDSTAKPCNVSEFAMTSYNTGPDDWVEEALSDLRAWAAAVA